MFLDQSSGRGVDSDNDFVVSPRSLECTLAKGAKSNTIKSKVPTIRTRYRIGDFSEVLQSLTNEKRTSVVDMGFGGLLDLVVKETLSKLGYWVVDSFDPRCQLMKLPRGDLLRVTEEDVASIFGFPHGGIEIVRKSKEEVGELAKQWRAIFGREDHRITPSLVYVEMLKDKDGGEWFRSHFVVLVVIMLVDGMQNDYCNHHYMHHFQDSSRIRDLNWCEFVIKSLRDSKLAWDRQRCRKFIDLILFLMVCYLNIFVC